MLPAVAMSAQQCKHALYMQVHSSARVKFVDAGIFWSLPTICPNESPRSGVSMPDMNELPDDADSLKQLVLERDATLEAMSLALHEAQLRFDQLALLLRKSRHEVQLRFD